MQIDWFTFGAQIVNFVILVLLLRRFLYGPITRAMDAREAALAARFRMAEEEAAIAAGEAERLRQTRAELEQTREEVLQAAAVDADARRLAMVADARAEVETMQTRWYDDITHERETFLAEAQAQLTRALVTATDHALTDLADESLEQKMVDRFADRLVHLPAYQRHALVESVGDMRDDVVIRTSHELAFGQRQQLIEALQQLLAQEVSARHVHDPAAYVDELGVHFAIDASLGCGIELLVRDRRIAWSIRDYVDAMAGELSRNVLVGPEPA